MDGDAYEDLPEDDEQAFLHLEFEFRRTFEELMEDFSTNYNYVASDYMNKTLAAASALNIEALGAYTALDHDNRVFYDQFNLFRRDVDNLIVQMRVLTSRRKRSLSVDLSPEQKTKVCALIDKIRQQVEASSASQDKKDKLFKLLSALQLEVDRRRTRFEYFGDMVRGLSALSRHAAEEGAEPWWKWVKMIGGILDDAKSSEPALPAPPQRKRLEPPRKALPKIDGYSDMDDEIPF